MTYHADFCVLAGTTTPVVALAAIVSAGSTLTVLAGEKRVGARLIKGGTCFVGLINIALQVVVAQAALTSLAIGHDNAPMHATTDHVVTGLSLLFVSLVGRMLAGAGWARGKARATDPVSRVGDAWPESEVRTVS